MKEILVLGGGLVGSAIARNLSTENNLEITVADVNEKTRARLSSKYGLKTVDLDATDEAALIKAVSEVDLVIGAVPGSMGYKMLQTVIKTGTDIVDISFCPEDMLKLNQLAVDNNVTAIVDAGLQPGLGNLIIGRYNELYDTVTDFTCYVGGLPIVRHWPCEYQSVFSPIDVIAEYMRPARMRADGKIVSRPALSELELVDLPKIGTLEAFNTDGLRSLIETMPIDNMVEKTMRYPGHTEKMLMLRELGFFSEEPMDTGGTKVAPVEVTSRLLFEDWKPKDDGHDLAVLRIEITGTRDGKEVITTFDMYDEYEKETMTTSMARTTGYTCAAAARLVLAGQYTDKGIKPLEFVGADKQAYETMIEDLKRWGIVIEKFES